MFQPRVARLLSQFARYLVVGFIAFVFDMTTLIVGTEVFHANYLMSAAVGFLVGLIVNYLLSIRWVFDRRTFDQPGMEIAVFAVIGFGGLVLTEMLLWFGQEVLACDYRLTKILAVGIVLVWNFGMRKWILFREPAERPTLVRAT